MSFSEADWEMESDYARFVLREPTAEQLREAADLERKALRENVFACFDPEAQWISDQDPGDETDWKDAA